MRFKIPLAIMPAFALAGCAVAAKIDARNDYQASRAQYKDCLAQHAARPHACEGLRLAMEADERAYNDLNGGHHFPSGVFR
jgi:hypothetical protein